MQLLFYLVEEIKSISTLPQRKSIPSSRHCLDGPCRSTASEQRASNELVSGYHQDICQSTSFVESCWRLEQSACRIDFPMQLISFGVRQTAEICLSLWLLATAPPPCLWPNRRLGNELINNSVHKPLVSYLYIVICYIFSEASQSALHDQPVTMKIRKYALEFNQESSPEKLLSIKALQASDGICSCLQIVQIRVGGS